LKLIVKGDETNDTLIAEKRESTVFQSLMECFRISKGMEPNRIQAIVRYSENKCERIIDLKSISGVRNNFIFIL
jgi:hypothetical protein